MTREVSYIVVIAVSNVVVLDVSYAVSLPAAYTSLNVSLSLTNILLTVRRTPLSLTLTMAIVLNVPSSFTKVLVAMF